MAKKISLFREHDAKYFKDYLTDIIREVIREEEPSPPPQDEQPPEDDNKSSEGSEGPLGSSEQNEILTQFINFLKEK